MQTNEEDKKPAAADKEQLKEYKCKYCKDTGWLKPSWERDDYAPERPCKCKLKSHK